MSSVSGVSSTSPFDVSSPSAKTTSATAQDSTTTSSSSTSSTDGLTSSAGTEFLDLLIDELKNQDPSNAMDSTQMVGQMISLNQLDQLMSINGELSGTSTSTTSSTSGSSTANSNSADVMAARSALANSISSTPADSASAANANAVLDLSNLNNTHTSGVN